MSPYKLAEYKIKTKTIEYSDTYNSNKRDELVSDVLFQKGLTQQAAYTREQEKRGYYY